jgi:hypothetical protein
MKNKSLFYLLLPMIPMGCVMITIVIAMVYLTPSFKVVFNHFNKTNFNGRITFLGTRYKGEWINIDGKNDTLIFYPKRSKLNSNNDFKYFAELGDSIYKRSYSDTLFLIKNGVVYKYTFDKPD